MMAGEGFVRIPHTSLDSTRMARGFDRGSFYFWDRPGVLETVA